ncbi:MAG: hypothetical protein HQL33_04395 [Alphaproteobacteria bacterium]|nr:hypothetical protein [Alphaproteobacteria bacterium]MBF0129212.1 hypothetical protein [Alphaproteobacteria bacterium]
MKAEYVILGAGAVFVIGILGAAMMPDEVLQRDHMDPAPMNTGTAPNALPGQQAMNMPRTQLPAPVARNAAIPGLIPFTRAATQRYRGRVVSTVALGSEMGWGQVHIWISDGANPVQEISLAPDWYLTYLGCGVVENAQVEGIAFKFDKVQANVELYAKTITVNGKQCGLRNDEGFALWSNQLK